MANNNPEFGTAFRDFMQSNGYDETEVARFLYVSRTLPGILIGMHPAPQDLSFYDRLASMPFMGLSDLYRLVKAAKLPEWLEKWALKPREGCDLTQGVDKMVNHISNQTNFDEFEGRREQIELETRAFLINVRSEYYRNDLQRNYILDTTLPWRKYLAEN